MVLEIYKITKKFPKDEKFGITSQIRRAASSITANIAEGCGRYHYADKNRFYFQARGSLKEVQNFLFLSRDLNFLDNKSFNDLTKKIKIIEQLLNGLIKSVENRTKK